MMSEQPLSAHPFNDWSQEEAQSDAEYIAHLEAENERLKRENDQAASWVDEVRGTGITDHPTQKLTAWQRLCRWADALLAERENKP